MFIAVVLNQARAWFLEITLMRICMCVCVTPKAKNASGVILTLYDRLNSSSCFSVPFYGACRRYHR